MRCGTSTRDCHRDEATLADFIEKPVESRIKLRRSLVGSRRNLLTHARYEVGAKITGLRRLNSRFCGRGDIDLIGALRGEIGRRGRRLSGRMRSIERMRAMHMRSAVDVHLEITCLSTSRPNEEMALLALLAA